MQNKSISGLATFALLNIVGRALLLEFSDVLSDINNIYGESKDNIVEKVQGAVGMTLKSSNAGHDSDAKLFSHAQNNGRQYHRLAR